VPGADIHEGRMDGPARFDDLIGNYEVGRRRRLQSAPLAVFVLGFPCTIDIVRRHGCQRSRCRDELARDGLETRLMADSLSI
jgi:hypothetical protein